MFLEVKCMFIPKYTNNYYENDSHKFHLLFHNIQIFLGDKILRLYVKNLGILRLVF